MRGEGGGRIDREGARGDREHGGVVDGVAEHDIGGMDPGLMEGCNFALVGGDGEQLVGDDAAGDTDAGGEDTSGGDAELADAFLDDPVVGGADGPDFGSELMELLNQRAHFRKDAGADELGEVDAGDAAHFIFVQTLVHLDHFAADGELADVSAEVGAVAAVDEVDDLAGHEAGLDGPLHELGARVAGPESAVAVKDSGPGGGVEDGLVEGGDVKRRNGDDSTHGYSLSQTAPRMRPQVLFYETTMTHR